MSTTVFSDRKLCDISAQEFLGPNIFSSKYSFEKPRKDTTNWLAHLPEHISWTILSILLPALLVRIAFTNIPSSKSNVIGRFNERFRKWIDGYENWKTEGYYFHTVQDRLPIS